MFQYFKLLNSRSKTHIRELYTLHSNCSIGFHHCVLMLNSNTSCECTMVLNLTLYCQHLYWSIDQITDDNTHSTHAMWVIHWKHDNTEHTFVFAKYISHFQFTNFLQFILSSNRNGLTPRKRFTLWSLMHVLDSVSFCSLTSIHHFPSTI